MNIMIAADKNYFFPAVTLIVSLFHNHPDKQIILYFLCSGFSQEEYIRLEKLEKRYENKQIICLDITEEQTKGLHSFGRFSVGAFYRILALDMIPEEVDRILYLDVDMVVTRDISELFEAAMEKPVWVCYDINNYPQGNIEYHKNNAGLGKDAPYFNSGMILFDMKYVRENNTKDVLIKDIQCNFDRYKLVDQDALNRYYQGNCEFIPWEIYNCPCVPYISTVPVYQKQEQLAAYAKIKEWQEKEDAYRLYDVTTDILNRASIIHFCTEMKPWKDRNFYLENVNLQSGYRIYSRFERLAERLLK